MTSLRGYIANPIAAAATIATAKTPSRYASYGVKRNIPAKNRMTTSTGRGARSIVDFHNGEQEQPDHALVKTSCASCCRVVGGLVIKSTRLPTSQNQPIGFDHCGHGAELYL